MDNSCETVSETDASVLDISSGSIAPPSRRPLFWQRQFSPRPSFSQTLFDLMAGVLLPIVCIWLDPIVFTNDEPVVGSPLANWVVAGYTFIFLEILIISLWLLLGRRLGVLCAFVGGMLIAGAFFACSLGIAILPLTLIGLMMLIGVLGLSPFVTSFVFLRNCIRCLRSSEATYYPRLLWVLAILGATLAVGLPATAQREVSRLVSQLALLKEDESPEDRAIDIERARRVVRWFGIGTVDQLVNAYEREENPVAKKRIAEVYRQVTGSGIERRLSRLRD